VPRYPRQDESRAILFGTAQYDHYDPLPAIANNLETLRSVLISAKRGGFRSEHCHTISNPQDPGVLAEHIKDVAGQATDVLLVYCSGHGIIDWDARTLQLALEHTREEDLHYTALSIDLLKRSIAASPAKIKVLVLECCYSGRAIAGHAMSDVAGMLQEQGEMHGVYTLTSSSSNEMSLAPPDADFTAFSGIFIRLLREPSGDHSGGATLAEMFTVLRRELISRSYPEPQQSIENSGGELTLVGWDNDDDMPVVLVGPSAKDVPAAPDLAEHEQQPTITQEIANLLRHADASDAETEALTQAEIDQRLSDLLQQAKQIHNDGDGDDTPAKVLAALGRIVTEMIRTGGNEHPRVLYARDLESYWLANMRRFGEARGLLERVLRVREETYGGTHVEVLNTRQNLAGIIGLEGDAAEAARLLQQLAEDREQILGKADVNTQESLDSLAHWTGVSGDPQKAVTIYRDLLAEREWLYGPLDERTLDIQDKLANWTGWAGNATAARDIYEQLIMNWTQKPVPNSRNVERSQKNRDYWAARVQNEEEQ
jgi:Tetratricopeptide repeat/Caspase domain